MKAKDNDSIKNLEIVIVSGEATMEPGQYSLPTYVIPRDNLEELSENLKKSLNV